MLWETRMVCKECPIHHETQRSRRPHLPRWPEVVFTAFRPSSCRHLPRCQERAGGRFLWAFDPVCTTTPPSLARASRRSVFMGVSTPFMPAVPPSLARASRRLVFIGVSTSFTPPSPPLLARASWRSVFIGVLTPFVPPPPPSLPQIR